MSDPLTARTTALLHTMLMDEQVDLTALFSPGAVRLHVAREACSEPQAQLLASFFVNLLVRLHPIVQHVEIVLPARTPFLVSVPRWSASTLHEHIALMVNSVHSEVNVTVVDQASSAPMHDTQIGAGGAATARLYVGSVGWDVELDVDAACAANGMPNPIGAYSAACMGVAEIWKAALSQRSEFSRLPIFPLTKRLRFSTFSLLADREDDPPPIPSDVNLPSLAVIGAGAGGGALLYTLASLSHVTGSLAIVDPDVVEEPNLNRYIFADRGDATAHRDKPAVLAGMFARFTRLDVAPLAKPVADVHKELSYEYVVAAVHSRIARRDIQTETPKVLWDCAASGDGEFRIWRHFLGRSDCMWCKHPVAKDPERLKAAQLEQILGLEAALWERKIRDNQPFSDTEIRALRIPEGSEVTLPVVGERFDDWERRQCGKMHLPDLNADIPIPFAPVMAGILVAGEIIKEFYFRKATLDSYYWNTLTGQFMRKNRPWHRDPTPGCPLCQKKAFREQYTRRWGIVL